jgi:hypothetical protein
MSDERVQRFADALDNVMGSVGLRRVYPAVVEAHLHLLAVVADAVRHEEEHHEESHVVS